MLIFSPGLVEATREGMQDPDLEAGLAELEERLYTRWNISFTGMQVLLVESGEAWREALEVEDSTMHVLSGCNGEALLLSNIFPADKRLPLYVTMSHKLVVRWHQRAQRTIPSFSSSPAGYGFLENDINLALL